MQFISQCYTVIWSFGYCAASVLKKVKFWLMRYKSHLDMTRKVAKVGAV